MIAVIIELVVLVIIIYVIILSDFKKGQWSEEWDKLYREFMEDNVDKLWKFRYSFPALKKIKAEAEK